MKAQMEALTISYGKDDGSGAASISNSDSFGNSNAYSTGEWIRSLPRDDVLFPAKFLPTPVGIEYSSHAARAFHATTTTAHSPPFMDRAPSPPNMRWTQPPFVFAMRELDLVPLHPGETGRATLLTHWTNSIIFVFGSIAQAFFCSFVCLFVCSLTGSCPFPAESQSTPPLFVLLYHGDVCSNLHANYGVLN